MCTGTWRKLHIVTDPWRNAAADFETEDMIGQTYVCARNANAGNN